MIRGLYSAATGLEGAARNHDAVAENLANVNTPGFRRVGSVFETFEGALGYGAGATALAGTQLAASYSEFAPGPLQHTGSPLDVAVVGNAFFVVDGPTGPLLTRNGAFQLGGDNQLLTSSGFPVRGAGGPITIPPGTARITVAPDGRVLADNALIDRLQLVRVADPSQLRRVGPGYFEGADLNNQPEPGEARVEQGYREGSNVEIAREMVMMLLGMRHYEAAQRALRTLSEAVALNTRPE